MIHYYSRRKELAWARSLKQPRAHAPRNMKKTIVCVICAIVALAVIFLSSYLLPSFRSGGTDGKEPAHTETTEAASSLTVPTDPSATNPTGSSISSATIPSELVGWLSIHADTPVGFEGIICVELQNVSTGLLDLLQMDALTEYSSSYRLFSGEYIVTQAYILSSDHFIVQYPDDVLNVNSDNITLNLTVTADQQFEDALEDIRTNYEPSIPPEIESSDSQDVVIPSQFYFPLDYPDTDYVGHAVPELTASQIASIKNTLYGEAGYSLETMILVAQAIRDNVDRSPLVTYDNFVTECQFFGGYEERPASVYDTALVNQAFDYIFVQGNSAVQHRIYCFYTRTPSLQTDDDYQALFALPLEFIIEADNTRFFCWNE